MTHVFSKIDRDKLGTKDSDSFPPAPPPLISPGGAEQIASVDDTMDDMDQTRNFIATSHSSVVTKYQLTHFLLCPVDDGQVTNTTTGVLTYIHNTSLGSQVRYLMIYLIRNKTKYL